MTGCGSIFTCCHPYRVPQDHELPHRLHPVLTVIYLVYNAGLTEAAKQRPTEQGLCTEAIRLARILMLLLPDEAEVAGLLALLLLVESRRATRRRRDGSLVVLADQGRHQRRTRRCADLLRCLGRNSDASAAYQRAATLAPSDTERDFLTSGGRTPH